MKKSTLVFLSFLIFSLNASQVFASDCTATYTGKVPLTDLGVNLYNGYQGGLYPNSSNTRPAAHETAGLLIANEIRPLDNLGQIDESNGRIGVVSIGMSNTNEEFEVFEYLANVDPNRNPRVNMINGAQSGQTAHLWADPNASAWSTLATIVSNRGFTNPQVQVAWIKLTIRNSDIGGNWEAYPFPANAELFRSLLKDVVRNLKDKYPNIKIAYLSSRVYGGYGPDSANPEPMAYEEGFGVKWLLEDQINGDPLLSYSGSSPEAPYLSWGPYLWADGLGSDNIVGGVPGRSDGMEYLCSDVIEDGIHPSTSGRQKVASQLLNFLNTDTTSRPWYINPAPQPTNGTPFYLDLDGVNDYLDVADSNAFSFTNGTQDTPLTFEVWMRPDNVSIRQALLSKWLDGSNIEYKLTLSGGAMRFDMKDPSANATVSAYSGALSSSLNNSWHHVAVTYDGRGGATAANGINMYLDGVPVTLTRANTASYVAMENTIMPLQIGRETAGMRQFNGGLDEIRMWNIARTQAQIQSSMTSELLGTEPGLVAYWKFNEGIGATVVDDSLNSHTAIAHNDPVWVSGGPMQPPAPDTTPPSISNVSISNITDTSAIISFTTNEVTTGWVSYTQNTSCPCTDVYSPISGNSHTINLVGLTPNSSYIYEAKALDMAGNFQVGLTTSFSTLAIPPDITLPAVSITNPAAGNVTGTIQISANATDNVGVTSVQFILDGANYGAQDISAPYSLSWDTTTVTDGTHTLRAEARDQAGNVGVSSTVSFTVNNDLTPPTVSITAPTAGSTVSGTSVTISANASDNTSVAGVQFKVDGNNIGAEDTTFPYSITWNSNSVTNGAHSITAVARDVGGNTATSTAVNVNVSNIAPPGPANPVLLDTSSSSVNKTSHNSQTISPSPNSLLLVSISTAAPSGTFSLSIADTLPGTETWNQVSAGSTQAHSWRTAIFYVQTNSLTGSGIITVTSSINTSRWVMHVSEIPNASVFQSATNFGNTTSLNVTFPSTPASNSIIFGAVASRRDSDLNILSGSGFTQHSENNVTADPSNTLQTQYGPSTPSSTWSGLGNSNNIGVAVEIR